MKNIIAINGSPRRNWNTAQLLQHAMQGAQEAGASAELVNLYALNFKGCTSCFACKLKSRPHGSCAMRDELSPVLEAVTSADAVIFGSPIYFMNLSSGMIAFMERLLFSNYIYSDEVPTVFPKKLPNAFIYTMNMTAKHFEQFGMSARLGMMEVFAEKILGVVPKILRVFDTVQFKDYSRYESSIFDGDAKLAHREAHFAEDCAAAYAIGRELVTK